MNQFYLCVETEGSHLSFNYVPSALHCNSLCIFMSDYKRHSFESIIKDCDDGAVDNVLLRMHEGPKVDLQNQGEKTEHSPRHFQSQDWGKKPGGSSGLINQSVQ